MRQARQFIFPREAMRDEGFREETLTRSRVGLRVLGWMEIAVAVVSQVGDALTLGNSPVRRVSLMQAVCMLAVGVASVLLARTGRAKGQALKGAVTSAWLVGAILASFQLVAARLLPEVYHYTPGMLAMVKLVTVAAIPLAPWQAFLFASSLDLYYQAAVWVARQQGLVAPPLDAVHFASMTIASLLCAGMAGLVFQQRWMKHRSFRESLRAKTKALTAEKGASLGRLAAALSHELNTPIGALKSSVDTLLKVTERLAQAGPTDRERLLRLQLELRASITESAGRLEQIVGKMQRFAHLDRAEIFPADLNSILQDVVGLLQPEQVRIEMRLAPLPEILCQPQQMSSAFHTLLRNAIEAGGENGAVTLATSLDRAAVRVVIEDSGKGMAQGEAEGLFDLRFTDQGGRMGAGHWGLFSARQIIQEHGGDILVQAAEGRGTRVNVVLPVGTGETASLFGGKGR